MRRILRTAIIAGVLIGSIINSVAQNPASPSSQQSEVILTKLTQPVYPPLARQVRISGDVELTIEIRKDGRIQSAVVVRGHPLLKQAALDSAQQSQFECRNCGDTAVAVQLVYSFELGACKSCEEAEADQKNQSFPRVIQSEKHVTLTDRAACTCTSDPGVEVRDVRKVRSLKCLYLWRCRVPRLISYE